MSRVSTAVGLGTRELRRTPVLLALLFFLPAYLVGVFAAVAPDSAVTFQLAGGELVRTSLSEAFPAFTTPMAAALLAGIGGLFLMHTSAEADARLAVAGYRAHEIVLARIATLVAIGAAGTVVAVATMHLAFQPANVGWFALAVFLAALNYGTVGVIAGVVLDRLPGVYLVLFGSMIDLFLFQNPLAADSPAIAAFAPGHYPIELAMDAGFSESVSPAPLGWSLLVLGLLAAAATLAFYRSVSP